MADGGEAITNTFVAVFGSPDVRLMRYFHILGNVEKYLKLLTKGGICGHIKVDIQVLQLCKDERTFLKASILFIQKWKQKKDV